MYGVLISVVNTGTKQREMLHYVMLLWLTLAFLLYPILYLRKVITIHGIRNWEVVDGGGF